MCIYIYVCICVQWLLNLLILVAVVCCTIHNWVKGKWKYFLLYQLDNNTRFNWPHCSRISNSEIKSEKSGILNFVLIDLNESPWNSWLKQVRTLSASSVCQESISLLRDKWGSSVWRMQSASVMPFYFRVDLFQLWWKVTNFSVPFLLPSILTNEIFQSEGNMTSESTLHVSKFSYHYLCDSNDHY